MTFSGGIRPGFVGGSPGSRYGYRGTQPPSNFSAGFLTGGGTAGTNPYAQAAVANVIAQYQPQMAQPGQAPLGQDQAQQNQNAVTPDQVQQLVQKGIEDTQQQAADAIKTVADKGQKGQEALSQGLKEVKAENQQLKEALVKVMDGMKGDKNRSSDSGKTSNA